MSTGLGWDVIGDGELGEAELRALDSLADLAGQSHSGVVTAIGTTEGVFQGLQSVASIDVNAGEYTEVVAVVVDRDGCVTWARAL